MAAAANTALLSCRGLRRCRLGHIGPHNYPQNKLGKWGRRRKTNNDNGIPANLIEVGSSTRLAPSDSLVLGGEKSIHRRKNVQSKNRANGRGDMNGKKLGYNLIQQQRSSMASWRHAHNRFSHTNNIGTTDGRQLNRKLSTGTASNEGTMTSYNNGGYSSDLVVFLDMDECLIHSQFLSDELVDNDKYRQVEDRSSSSTHQCNEEAIISPTCESFLINLPDGDLVKVNKRPHLDAFLKEITSKFETHIFTAAMQVYASPILNHIDPTGEMFSGRFFREHCSYHPDLGVFAKDLCDALRMRKTMINNDSLPDDEISNSSNKNFLPCDERRVVLVDNNPVSFIPNPSNGILVSSFYDDPKDETLEAVLELLNELDNSEDVRPILDNKFGLKETLGDFVKGTSTAW